MEAAVLDVMIVRCLRDNLAYVVRRAGAREAVAVDVGEAGPVLAAARAASLDLVAVLSTHHHADHVGGNLELRRALPGLRVFGSAASAASIPALTDPLATDQHLSVAGLELDAIAVPGHTLGGVAFAGHGWVFTGDTLFGAGCGRLFEGTAALLHASLRRLVERLPPSTKVGFGHEYTEQNLRFAAGVEPDNPELAARVARVAALRASGAPSAPSTLGEELATNPFLRVHSPALRQHLGLGPAVADEDVFAELRARKDRS